MNIYPKHSVSFYIYWCQRTFWNFPLGLLTSYDLQINVNIHQISFTKCTVTKDAPVIIQQSYLFSSLFSSFLPTFQSHNCYKAAHTVPATINQNKILPYADNPRKIKILSLDHRQGNMPSQQWSGKLELSTKYPSVIFLQYFILISCGQQSMWTIRTCGWMGKAALLEGIGDIGILHQQLTRDVQHEIIKIR